jgi:hypothetical protein
MEGYHTAVSFNYHKIMTPGDVAGRFSVPRIVKLFVQQRTGFGASEDTERKYSPPPIIRSSIIRYSP